MSPRLLQTSSARPGASVTAGIRLAALGLGLTLLAGTGHAQPNNPDGAAVVQTGFSRLDKNGDGAVTAAEAAAEKEIAKRLKAFDANKDGKLQEAEFQKAEQDNAKRVLKDSAITTKIKGELLVAKGIPSTAISVETYEGRVQLSGFVDNPEQIKAAAKIAAGVADVKGVQNNLKVK